MSHDLANSIMASTSSKEPYDENGDIKCTGSFLGLSEYVAI